MNQNARCRFEVAFSSFSFFTWSQSIQVPSTLPPPDHRHLCFTEAWGPWGPWGPWGLGLAAKIGSSIRCTRLQTPQQCSVGQNLRSKYPQMTLPCCPTAVLSGQSWMMSTPAVDQKRRVEAGHTHRTDCLGRSFWGGSSSPSPAPSRTDLQKRIFVSGSQPAPSRSQ